MTKSKAVKEGLLVTKQGDKIILCSSKRKPLGVWTGGGARQTLTLDWEKITTNIPEGVVIYGPVTVTKTGGKKCPN